jgi:hypothetical protein
MEVRMDADGNPDAEDIARLAQEMVVVRTEMK